MRSLSARTDMQSILAVSMHWARDEDRVIHLLEKKFIEDSVHDDLFREIGPDFIKTVRRSPADSMNAPLTMSCLVALECFEYDSKAKSQVIKNIRHALPVRYGINNEYLVKRVHENFDRRKDDVYTQYDFSRIIFRAAWLFHKYLSDPNNVHNEVHFSYASDVTQPNNILSLLSRQDLATYDFLSLLLLLRPSEKPDKNYKYSDINNFFNSVITTHIITNKLNEDISQMQLARLCYIAIALYDFSESFNISRHFDRGSIISLPRDNVSAAKQDVKKELSDASKIFLFT